VLIRAYLVSGEFRVHRADCRDCTREARRSDSGDEPEEFPSRAAVIRSLWSDMIAEDPASTAPRTAWPAWKPAPSSCPAPAGCQVSDPAARGPAGGSAGPAAQETAARRPRRRRSDRPRHQHRAGPGHSAVHRPCAGLPGSRESFHLPGPPVHRQRVSVQPRLARQRHEKGGSAAQRRLPFSSLPPSDRHDGRAGSPLRRPPFPPATRPVAAHSGHGRAGAPGSRRGGTRGRSGAVVW
jgi:hypothetical protein